MKRNEVLIPRIGSVPLEAGLLFVLWRAHNSYELIEASALLFKPYCPQIGTTVTGAVASEQNPRKRRVAF